VVEEISELAETEAMLALPETKKTTAWGAKNVAEGGEEKMVESGSHMR
jgi:hypothetical protein